jgi:hypothetical protein
LSGKGHKNVSAGHPGELIPNPFIVAQHSDSKTNRPVNFSNEVFDIYGTCPYYLRVEI